MCRNLTVVIDCVCSKRVIEIYEKKNKCDCLLNVLFYKLEVSFCINCELEETTMDKIISVINFFASGEDDVFLYYEEDPLMCVERIFR